MSTPLIFLAIPLLTAVLLFFLRFNKTLSVLMGSIISLFLFILALTLPENLIVTIGNFSIEIVDKVFILGRSLTIGSKQLAFVAFFFLIAFLWIFGSAWFKVNDWMITVAFLITPILVAALCVEPFLYAALLIELVVMLCIPLLVTDQNADNPGIHKFLIYNTLAMPLILFSGWMLSGIETAPITSPIISRVTFFLLLGIALWLTIFPFHSWLPMVSEKSHLWNVSLIVSLLPITILIILLTFLNQYAWLRTLPNLFNTLSLLGIMMIVIGGMYISIQNHLGRAFGYAVMIEIGFSILSIGLIPQIGTGTFSMLFFPRIMSYWLWAYSLTAIQQIINDLSFTNIKGMVYQYPFFSAGIIVGQLSLSGFPLLASFPVKNTLMLVTAQNSQIYGLWLVFGNAGILIYTIRLLLNLFNNKNVKIPPWNINERIQFIIPICTMIIFLVLIGLFPHWFLNYWVKIGNLFAQFPVIP